MSNLVLILTHLQQVDGLLVENNQQEAIFVAEIIAESTIAVNIPIPANATTVDLGVDSDQVVIDFENIRAAFQARGNELERLFFVESTYTAAFPAAETVITDGTTNLYEVIAYNTVGNELTFGLLGSGTINIATSTLNISSEDVILSGIDSETYTPESHDFITVRKVDPDINTLTRSSLNITAAANGAENNRRRRHYLTYISRNYKSRV